MAWIRGGLVFSLGLLLLFLMRRTWGMDRLAAGFALAFVEKWRENRMAGELDLLLSRTGKRS